MIARCRSFGGGDTWLFGGGPAFGGYIGGDYSHYFIRSTNFEAGIIAGIGYDGELINDFETVGDPAKTRVGGKRQSGLGPNSLDRMRLALSSGNPVLAL